MAGGLNPVEIATAFNSCTARVNWHARADARLVHFKNKPGTVNLTLDCDERTFKVAFKRTRATYVDYTKSIARALFAVLGALKAAGLPFECPATMSGMVIESRPTETADVYVRWQGPVDNIRLARLSGAIEGYTMQVPKNNLPDL